MNDTTPDYGEPWTPATFGKGSIVSSSGTPIIESFKLVKRAIQCVNATQGMTDPAKEIADMREALKEAHAALSYCNYVFSKHVPGPDSSYGIAWKQAKTALAKIQTILKP